MPREWRDLKEGNGQASRLMLFLLRKENTDEGKLLRQTGIPYQKGNYPQSE